jgi:nitronate monooxygenase
VKDVDEAGKHYSREEFDKVAGIFKPFFDELYIPLPEQPKNAISKFEKLVETLIRLKIPVFSFVFGIPDAHILKECKRFGKKNYQPCYNNR